MIIWAKRYGKLLLKSLISGGLIILLVYKLDKPAIRDGLSNSDPGAFLVAVIVFSLLIVLQGWRWLVIARSLGLPVSLGSAIALSFIGSFFSQLLPSSVGGDAVRVHRLYQSGLPLGLSFNSTLIDRIVAVFALVLLALGGFAILGWRTVPVQLSTILAAVSAAAAGGIAALLCLDRLPLPRWIAALSLVRVLTHIAGDARRVFLAPGTILVVIAASLVTHAAVSAVFWLLGRHVGLDSNLAACIAVVPLTTLFTIIPISVAGWGVREGAMVFAFALVGGNSSAALITSILLGLATSCASLPGVLFWLRNPR